METSSDGKRREPPEVVFHSVLGCKVQALGNTSELLLVPSVSCLENMATSPELGVGAHG